MRVEIVSVCAFEGLGRTGLGPEVHMDANPHPPIDFESREALRVWCILAGLALAPMPILHAVPSAFFYDLFESPPPGWVKITRSEAYWFTMFGLPVTAIFLAWTLPGAGRPGVPMRSIIVLCLLVAYNPFQYYLESGSYGEMPSRESPLIWSIWHLDTPLLIGLAATALLGRRTLRPIGKVVFHWGLFVCALWTAGPPLFDSVFYEILILRAFGI